ncbi:MAG TPA: hypothetical protein VM368_10035, partial [Flavisolibacter sp.]|nr:hypothetical protein [Flavisolibacter sp.]
MYGGGIINSGGNPWAGGAHQSSYGGGEWDIAVMKLTPDGRQKVYATFIGGSGIEQPHSMVVDAQGNLIIAGRSNSTNYPTRGNNFGSGGAYDIVVTKLNATGTDIIGSKKIGGDKDDGVNISPSRNGTISLQQNYGDDGRSEVILDGAGNILLASSSQSANFPTVNPFQAALKGTQDGVVLKFSPDLSSMLFSTYLGGDANDAAYVLSLHPTTGQLYVAGGTESPSLPSIAAGPMGTISNNGRIDGFVSIIDNTTYAIIKSVFVGTNLEDQIFGVQFDQNGFPYVMGQTKGTWPVRPSSVWSQPNGKQFIAKLLPDLSDFVYSTRFGKGEPIPDISPVAFLVDRC